jgi:hypothetical protein
VYEDYPETWVMTVINGSTTTVHLVTIAEWDDFCRAQANGRNYETVEYPETATATLTFDGSLETFLLDVTQYAHDRGVARSN